MTEIKILKIRPAASDADWLFVEADRAHETMCDFERAGDFTIKRWEVEVMPSLTQAEFDALPEFDGW